LHRRSKTNYLPPKVVGGNIMIKPNQFNNLFFILQVREFILLYVATAGVLFLFYINEC